MLARDLSLVAALAVAVIGSAFAEQAHLDPRAFRTNAVFSVDNDAMSLTSVVATIEASRNAPGYSALQINFYSFPLTAADIAAAARGNVESMDRKWTSKASNPKDYNHSNSVIQLTVDKDWKVWQVDMSVPGHGCTIASGERDMKNVLQAYQFDGTRLRLKGKGAFVCDMKFMGIPNQKFGWDLDLDVPVFRKALR